MHVFPHNAPQDLLSSTTNCLFNKLESLKNPFELYQLTGKEIKSTDFKESRLITTAFSQLFHI